MPRRTTLTPAVYEKIVASVRQGNYFSVACRSAGISDQTGRVWLRIGRETLDRPELTDETRDLFVRFTCDIEQAEAEFEAEQVAAIEDAARSRTKTVIKQLADGSLETSETEEVNNWAARAWLLERRSRNRWGRDQMPWLEALQVLVQEEILPPAALEIASRGIKALREDLQIVISSDRS